MNNKGLRLSKLVLVGFRKNYVVSFNPGVNIIYGDADTGKSSILRIINYLLGGGRIEVDHEIESSVSHAVLELAIDGVIYCIKRDIFDEKRLVEVYESSFNEISGSQPEKYAPTLLQNSTYQSFSDFLLGELNFPKVMLKQAPTKADSALARLSIRDLLKYCYLEQDDVGNRKILNQANPVVAVKNREVFKYIFNVLDSNTSELEVEISEKTKEKNDYENEYKIINKFLEINKFDSITEADNEIGSLEDDMDFLEERLKDVNNRVTADNQLYDAYIEQLRTISMQITEHEDLKDRSSKNIEQFTRLRNDYFNDIQKLNSVKASHDLIGQKEEFFSTCPICESEMELSEISNVFEISSQDRVSQEINSIKRRVRELEVLISDNRRDFTKASNLLDELYKEKTNAKILIDGELGKSVSPYLAERDEIVGQIALMRERRKMLAQTLRVRGKHKAIADRIAKLEADIIELRTKLENLRQEAPSLKSVLDKLSNLLEIYLQDINIKNRNDIRFNETTFLPIVRGNQYSEINSGGLRTIVSIGLLAVLMKSRLELDINLPNLLMIDTVGKYLGKTTEDKDKVDTDFNEDRVEGVSDPEKYANLYKYLIQLAEDYENHGKFCQIILVDNDIPEEIVRDYAGFVVAHFSSQGSKGIPTGLIDDWEQQLKPH